MRRTLGAIRGYLPLDPVTLAPAQKIGKQSAHQVVSEALLPGTQDPDQVSRNE